MLNANGPGFAGLYAGDVIAFYDDSRRVGASSDGPGGWSKLL